MRQKGVIGQNVINFRSGQSSHPLVAEMTHQNLSFVRNLHITWVLGQHDEGDVAGRLIREFHFISET